MRGSLVSGWEVQQELLKEARLELLQQVEDEPVPGAEPRLRPGVVVHPLVVEREPVDALREEVAPGSVLRHLVVEEQDRLRHPRRLPDPSGRGVVGTEWVPRSVTSSSVGTRVLVPYPTY